MIQTKPKSKRGRKSKPEWQRLRNEIKLHLDDGNYAVVKDMAREAGLSLNKFISRAVMGATIRKALTDDEYLMVRSLQGIANNLNQLTRRAHETGRIYEADLEDIQQSQERIWTAAEKIVSSLAALK